MRKILLPCLMMFTCVGCYTERTMQRQVTKGYVRFPGEFSNVVSKLIPPETRTETKIEKEYVKGDPIYIPPFDVQAECDSVVAALLKNENFDVEILNGRLRYRTKGGLWSEWKTIPVKIQTCPPCPPSRVDTFKEKKTEKETIVDNKKVMALSHTISDQDKKIASQKTMITILGWCLGVLAGIIILYFVFFKTSLIKNMFGYVTRIFKKN